MGTVTVKESNYILSKAPSPELGGPEADEKANDSL